MLYSTLTLYDSCPDQRSGKTIRKRLYYTDHHLLCGAFPANALADRLRELPRLRSLTIRRTNAVVHGLPWSTLSVILSVPHLREVKVIAVHFCPILRSGEQLNVDSLAPLTSFHYSLGVPAKSEASPAEVAALAAVLGKLCDTLERLILPPEPVPAPTLSRYHWPRLRELVFFGTTWVTRSAPPITLCSVTPALRRLSINLALDTPQMLCPPGYDHHRVWPYLDQLSISSPDPQDEIYDHLPPTLHELSLRYWPHICAQQQLRDIRHITNEPHYDSMIGPTAVLSILRRCNVPELDCLELEYRVDHDGDDEQLWRYIASALPRLTRLTIHRFRHTRDREQKKSVPLVSPCIIQSAVVIDAVSSYIGSTGTTTNSSH